MKDITCTHSLSLLYFCLVDSAKSPQLVLPKAIFVDIGVQTIEVIENEQNEDELLKFEKSKKKVVFFFCLCIFQDKPTTSVWCTNLLQYMAE